MSAPVSYTTAIRDFLNGRLAEGQTQTTQAHLIDALSVLPEERPHVFNAIRQLKRKGELIAEGNGYRYVPATSPEPQSAQIYRVIRAHKGVFTSADIATLAEVKIDRVRNVIDTLAAAGYIQEAGHNGTTKFWLATQLCRDTPKPPIINRPGRGGYSLERRAMAKLIDIFLNAADLGGPRMAETIREQLDILNRRFGGKGAKDDKPKN